MRVLILSPYPEAVRAIVAEGGDETVVRTERLTPPLLRALAPDWIISHGYRHILPPEVLALRPDRFVNLHISLLPWNRGADPNFWSFLEGTPKGVTVHHIDAGVDTGDIIAQREITFDGGETLAGSYDVLQRAVVGLFAETWPGLRTGRAERRRQPAGGTIHRARDKEPFLHLLARGWDTPVAVLERHGRDHGLRGDRQ